MQIVHSIQANELAKHFSLKLAKHFEAQYHTSTSSFIIKSSPSACAQYQPNRFLTDAIYAML
jgi:hypothetical protein